MLASPMNNIKQRDERDSVRAVASTVTFARKSDDFCVGFARATPAVGGRRIRRSAAHRSVDLPLRQHCRSLHLTPSCENKP
jgi:hypothetical protein